ncbi:MAG: hypothetical protein JWM72_284 [Actinomycetia bacterium]|nr:hypothetical protein [Actinomycetes bacterium]
MTLGIGRAVAAHAVRHVGGRAVGLGAGRDRPFLVLVDVVDVYVQPDPHLYPSYSTFADSLIARLPVR